MQKTTRARGLAPWRPQKKTLILIQAVQGILEMYRQYLPLSCRQIFYRLVGIDHIAKDEKQYARLCEHLNRARRSGLIDPASIRDDGVSRQGGYFYQSADQVLHRAHDLRNGFKLHPQTSQPTYQIVGVEASGMAPMVANMTQDYGVDVVTCGGFDSLSAKIALAKDLMQHSQVMFHHAGDFDPNGAHIYTALSQDIKALMLDMGYTGDIQFRWTLILPQHISQFKLPKAPVKDTRLSFDGDETVQAEALQPEELLNLIREAIEENWCAPTYTETWHEEKAQLAQLGKAFGDLPWFV